jgi:SSS family solute:Na+ symporter
VGFIAPGVLAIFLMGFCWKRTTSTAALLGAVLTIPLSTVLKFLPVWTSGLFPDFAFLNRMSIVFVTLVALMTVVTLMDKKSKQQERVLIIDNSMFKPSATFVVGSVLIIGILTALYTVFW